MVSSRTLPSIRHSPFATPDSRRLAEAVVERIAGAAHGADRVRHAAAVERLAQASDVDVDRALVDIDIAAPDLVEQLLAREDAAWVFQQELEQAKLGRPERHLAARARHPLGVTVELDVTGSEQRRDPLGLGAAQQRADAGEQL